MRHEVERCMAQAKREAEEAFGAKVEFTNNEYTRHGWCPPTLKMQYHETQADGTKAKKATKAYFVPNYCQFCGAAIGEDNEPADPPVGPEGGGQ